MKLPGAEWAFIDIRKLRDYCLNPEHPRGRHKARIFAASLGLTMKDAERLRDAILSAALVGEAQLSEEDEYGQRYTSDFIMDELAGQATVRTLWIVRRDEEFPRLTSCYVV
jgi:hypothetical protein